MTTPERPASPPDLALAVAEIMPDAQYRRAGTYAELARTWADARPLPSEIALEAAWGQVVYRQQQAAQAEADLRQRREQHNQPLDMARYVASEPLLRALAERLAWLETEVRALRGASAP